MNYRHSLYIIGISVVSMMYAVDNALERDVQASVSASVGVPDENEFELIDAICVTIYTADGIDNLMLSQLERPSIDGQQRTIEDFIDETLMYRDGANKLTINEATVDAYVTQFKKQNNLTDDQVQDIAAQAGYTMAELRQEFKRLQVVAQMIDHNVTSKIRMLPEDDISAYYKEHPVYCEARYTLERAVIATLPVNQADYTQLQWVEFPEIQENELAEHLLFVTSMQEGQVSKPRSIEGGYELFRLKRKQPRMVRSLDERRREIMDILRRPKYEQALADYKKRLRSQAHIVYFTDDADMQALIKKD